MSNPSNDAPTEVTTNSTPASATPAPVGEIPRMIQPPGAAGTRPAPRFGGGQRFGGGAPRRDGDSAPAGGSSAGGGERRFGSGPRRGGRPGGGRFGGRGRKVCQFCADNVRVVDYKDFNRIRHFMSDRGKIEPRRKYGTCARHQRSLTTAIKRARFLALLPYVAAHTR